MKPLPELPRLVDYVRHWAEIEPEREAAVMDDIRITYAELSSRVADLSRALIANGVGHGDRIAMLTPPHPEFLVSMLATTDVGAIWLGLHPRYRLPELHHAIGEAQPEIVFAFDRIDGREYAQELAVLAAEHPCIRETVIIGETQADARGLDDFVSSGRGIGEVALRRSRLASATAASRPAPS